MTAPRPAPGFATAEEALDLIETQNIYTLNAYEGERDDRAAAVALLRSELASLREMATRARAAEERVRAEALRTPVRLEAAAFLNEPRSLLSTSHGEALVLLAKLSGVGL